MTINKAIPITSFILAIFLALACNNQKQEPQTNKKEEVKEQIETMSSPDSVIVTVAMKGKRDRLNILQQKVMLMAKKKLADSLIKLNNMHSDTSVADPNDYEISIRDMQIIKEGLRYPDKNKPEVIEAYITLGVQYKHK